MIRALTITAVANGWLVRIGCHTFVYTDATVLVVDVQEYLEHPAQKEKAMLAQAQNLPFLTNDTNDGPAAIEGLEGFRLLESLPHG